MTNERTIQIVWFITEGVKTKMHFFGSTDAEIHSLLCDIDRKYVLIEINTYEFKKTREKLDL